MYDLKFVPGLSHVRHLSTVRNHLSSLVQPTVVADDDVTRQGLTREKWSELYRDGKVKHSHELVETRLKHLRPLSSRY